MIPLWSSSNLFYKICYFGDDLISQIAATTEHRSLWEMDINSLFRGKASQTNIILRWCYDGPSYDDFFIHLYLNFINIDIPCGQHNVWFTMELQDYQLHDKSGWFNV